MGFVQTIVPEEVMRIRKKNTSTLNCLDITTLFLATQEPNDKLPMVANLRS